MDSNKPSVHASPAWGCCWDLSPLWGLGQKGGNGFPLPVITAPLLSSVVLTTPGPGQSQPRFPCPHPWTPIPVSLWKGRKD